MKYLIILCLIWSNIQAQTKLIGVVSPNKILRLDSSYVELQSCGKYNTNIVVKEYLEPLCKDFISNSEGMITYYLTDVSGKYVVLMVNYKTSICNTSTWYDGIFLNNIYFRL